MSPRPSPWSTASRPSQAARPTPPTARGPARRQRLRLRPQPRRAASPTNPAGHLPQGITEHQGHRQAAIRRRADLRPAPPLQAPRCALGTPHRTPRRLRLPRLQPHLLQTPQEGPLMIVLRAHSKRRLICAAPPSVAGFGHRARRGLRQNSEGAARGGLGGGHRPAHSRRVPLVESFLAIGSVEVRELGELRNRLSRPCQTVGGLSSTGVRGPGRIGKGSSCRGWSCCRR